LIKTKVFYNDVVDFIEERVFCIGLEYFFIPAAAGHQQTCLFEAVQFNSNGVGRFAKFSFKAAQISSRMAVEKKFQQQFNPGFGRNQRVYHFQN
jgi:hypothetical protein